MMLSAKQIYLTLCGLVVLSLVILGAGAYAGTQFLAKKSKDVHDASVKQQALEQKEDQLRKARADIERYGELAQIAKNIVPQDKDQAPTVREISNLAAANGITLSSITFPSSTLGEGLTPNQADSQLTPVAAMPGTFVLSITVQSDSSSPTSFQNLTGFLEALESNRRTALVKNISIVPNVANPKEIQFSLTLDEYIKP